MKCTQYTNKKNSNHLYLVSFDAMREFFESEFLECFE